MISLNARAAGGGWRIGQGHRTARVWHCGAKARVKPAVANRAPTRLRRIAQKLRQWYSVLQRLRSAVHWWARRSRTRRPTRRSTVLRGSFANNWPAFPSGREPGIHEPIWAIRRGGKRWWTIGVQHDPVHAGRTVALARKEYAWCETEMIRASRELKLATTGARP